MNDLKVIRYASGEKGTHGVMVRGDVPFCLTLEPSTPIIRPGIYIVRKFLSPHFKREVLLFDAVPGHTTVEIHAGNTIADTKGCILVGLEVGIEGYLLQSNSALNKILKTFPDIITVEVCENWK